MLSGSEFIGAPVGAKFSILRHLRGPTRASFAKKGVTGMGKLLDETFLRMEFDALWDGFTDDKCYLVTLSQRDISVLVSCLRYTVWPSRWFDSGGSLLRDVGRLPDLEIAITYAESLKARIIMACNIDESLARIATAVENLPGAIAAASCCQGVGPGYVEDGEGGTWYGSEQPDIKPDQFGEGEEFESLTEFEQHLCQAANNIVAGLVLSFNNWSVLSLAGLVAGGLIVAFIVAAPPLGVMIALGAAGFAFGLMSTISNYIDDHRQEWVCAIYNAEGYASMLVNIDQQIDAMTIELDLGAFSINLTDIIHAALSTDVFNQAYRAVGLPPVTGAIDCLFCSEVTDCVYWDFVDSQTHQFEDDDTPPPAYVTPSSPRDVVPTGGGLQLSASVASTRQVWISRENITLTIQTGQNIIQHYTNNISVGTRIQVVLITDVGVRQFYNDHGAGEFEHTASLNAYAGEVIEKVYFGIGSNGGDIQVTLHDLEITCV
jgi:hypothetical protein